MRYLCLLLVLISRPLWAGFELMDQAIKVSGTSTLHDWEMNLTKSQWQLEGEDQLNKIIVTSKVSDLMSDSEIMNEKAWAAFDLEQFPKIKFESSTLTLNQDGLPSTIEGLMTMHGQTKKVIITSLDSSRKSPKGPIRIAGAVKINMKHFGMKPPSIMFMNVGENVEVQFNFIYQRVNP